MDRVYKLVVVEGWMDMEWEGKGSGVGFWSL